MKSKSIGVLGGMGPESTAIFYQSIILQCQKQYGAQYDEDYPEIFIYNLPIPDMVEGIKNPEKVLPVLIRGIKRMESIGVDFIAIPCNTTHYFFDELQKNVKIPILNIIEETVKKVKSKGYKRVGLLATVTTVENRIYGRIFDKFGVEIVTPRERQSKVTKIIRNILAGRKSEADRQELKRIVKEMKKEGAGAIVIGCTDITTILRQEDVDVELFDSVDILAEATVKYAVVK